MLLTLALLSALQGAPADSLTGTWQITGDVMGTAVNSVCTIKQEATVLSGSCEMGGARLALTGEAKDGRFTFRHGGEYEGTPLTIVYSGTLGVTPEVKGSISVLPFDVGGAFTATPKP